MQDFDDSRLVVTEHALLRLQERFPGREWEIIGCCERFFQKHKDFVWNCGFRYKLDDFVAVIVRQKLVTAYHKKDRRLP